MSVAPGIQVPKDKTRPVKVKEEGGVTPAVVGPDGITVPPSPAPSLRRSASSEFTVDDSCNAVADTKNAPRFVYSLSSVSCDWSWS